MIFQKNIRAILLLVLTLILTTWAGFSISALITIQSISIRKNCPIILPTGHTYFLDKCPLEYQLSLSASKSIHSLALAGPLAIIFLILFLQLQKNKTHAHNEATESNQQTLNYIKQQLEDGVTQEQIINTLTANGWGKNDVNKIFSELRSSKLKQALNYKTWQNKLVQYVLIVLASYSSYAIIVNILKHFMGITIDPPTGGDFSNWRISFPNGFIILLQFILTGSLWIMYLNSKGQVGIFKKIIKICKTFLVILLLLLVLTLLVLLFLPPFINKFS